MYNYNRDHAFALGRKLPQCKSWFLIVVSFVLIGVYGVCLASAPSGMGKPFEFDQKTVDAFLQSGERGVLIAMAGDPALCGALQLTCRLQTGDMFAARFLLCNQTGEMLSYRLIILADYRQHVFELGGVAGTSHPLKIDSNSCKTYMIGVSHLGAGAHDLVFAAIRYVGDKPTGRGGDFAVLAHRMNLLVGRNEFPAYTLLENLEHTPRRGNIDAEIRFVSPTSNVPPDKDGGSRALLSVAVGNMLEQSLTHALLLFSGDVQIAAMDGDTDTGVKPMFFIVEPQSVVRANVHILQQRERLWALIIESPYALLEEKRGIMTKIPMAVRISNVLD
ncbi:MAG: hypothetical protein IDH49_08330 [Gammaproteobacteria bacterium]|nr:hypothetical protein [Gammaproteobacteria bacterium]